MKRPDGTYRIGDLASMFGLTVRSIRYYEELGLIQSEDRSEGLHRRYPEKTIVHLQRIAQLKRYGLSLAEIKHFFALASFDRSGEACRELLVRKYGERMEAEERVIREAEARLAELKWHVRQLETVKDFFECPGRLCPECEFAGNCALRIPAEEKTP